MSDTILTHYEWGEFEDRLEAANRATHLNENDRDFLFDIEAKHDQYGEDAFFSEAQARYLNMLSVRGGYVGTTASLEEGEILSMRRARKRR